jgi:hypothetical protein
VHGRVEAFDFERGAFAPRGEGEGAGEGALDFALRHGVPLNRARVLAAPGYREEADGDGSEPVLAAPLGSQTAVALRGRTVKEPFGDCDLAALGILFKNQSVMETHHCAVAIDIISKEEANIFSTLDPDEYKAMWTMIIAMILSTDMAKHFPFLKEVRAQLDAGPLDPTDPKDRYTMMNLILKCADISNVSRPFEMANRWCDVLCEEFFRQGELESTHRMEYTSPLNDKAHLDKAKSQIGFYTFVCLTLYQMAARAMPPLQVNVDQVQSNLAIWKAADSEAQKSQ